MPRVVQIARYQADGTQVTREFEQMGRAGEQMSQRVQRGAQSMTPALRGIDAAAGVAQQKLQGLASSTGSLGTVLTAMGPAGLAAAAAIGGLALAFGGLRQATREAVRDLGGLYDTSRQLGVSTAFMQEFRFAVLGVGGSIGAADSALSAFSRNLGQLNTELGKRARAALTETLGFSEDDIRAMRSVEDAMPRIIERIGRLRTASEQQAAAQKLGLEGVVQVLQAGQAAFERAANEAHRMGYVLDTELLRRASEFNGAWAQASETIGVQFKAALVDLAPVFVDLTRSMAGTARQLRDLLDLFKDTEHVSERTAQLRAEAAIRGANALRERFGDDVTFGGVASRVPAMGSWQALIGLGGPVIPQNLQQARDRYARYMEEFNRAVGRVTETQTPPSATQPGAPDPTAADAALAQMQQFIAQLEEEARVRERLGQLRAENAKASDDELRAVIALEDDLRKLAEARERGVIASDEELARLEDLRRGRDAESAAVRAQQAELARLNQIRAANDNLRRQVETPQERIQREIADLTKASNEGFLDAGLAAERVRQLREEYSRLAEAQYEASLQGRVLQGVIQGQIRNFEDLKRTLLAMVADAALREFFSMLGGGDRSGGIGGLIGRIGGRLGLGSLGEAIGGIISHLPFGGPRAGGGPMYAGHRYSVAEIKPEVTLVGGWGHVAPSAAVDGLAVLSRLSRLSQAPANSNVAPNVTINLHNESGAPVEARAETRTTADGGLVLDVMLARQNENAVRSGRLNGAMRDHFNLQPPMVNRG